MARESGYSGGEDHFLLLLPPSRPSWSSLQPFRLVLAFLDSYARLNVSNFANTLGIDHGMLGWLVWGPDGILMLVAVGVFGVAMNPGVSPWWVMRLYGARPISPHQAPKLSSLVRRLTARADLRNTPDLYYVPSSMLNAFAAGTRQQAAIAVTDGLLRKLALPEVAGVFAHEISHVRNNDLWVMGLADLFSCATNLWQARRSPAGVAYQRTLALAGSR